MTTTDANLSKLLAQVYELNYIVASLVANVPEIKKTDIFKHVDFLEKVEIFYHG